MARASFRVCSFSNSSSFFFSSFFFFKQKTAYEIRLSLVGSEMCIRDRTSGHVQHVISVELDCDGDAVLLIVEQTGGACHTGKNSCFDEGGPLDLAVGSAS